jgi:hypothetical protein
MYTIFQKNIQTIPTNLVIVKSSELSLSHSRQKDTLEIERREKNTYYNKIIGINQLKNI